MRGGWLLAVARRERTGHRCPVCPLFLINADIAVRFDASLASLTQQHVQVRGSSTVQRTTWPAAEVELARQLPPQSANLVHRAAAAVGKLPLRGSAGAVLIDLARDREQQELFGPGEWLSPCPFCGSPAHGRPTNVSRTARVNRVPDGLHVAASFCTLGDGRRSDRGDKTPGNIGISLVLPLRIELRTSPLPRECSTTELRQPLRSGTRLPRPVRQSAGTLPQAP